MKLTAGLFCQTAYPGDPGYGVMGLRYGQMRCPELIHNGCWYNGRGERIGYGDLDPADFARIQAEMASDDTFIVLNEGDGTYSFARNAKHMGLDTWVSEPGSAYLVKYAQVMITKEGTAFVDHGYTRNTSVTLRGVTYPIVPESAVKARLEGAK